MTHSKRQEFKLRAAKGKPGSYKAAPVNRFQLSWYAQHLLYSFWRVTETTKSVHTHLKTPGAYGFTQAAVRIKPEMLGELMLQQQSAGKTPTLHSLSSDKTTPEQIRRAMSALRQSTSSLVGSNGHRSLLQQEGVAYTLRYGPALCFLTPNLADSKQQLLLVVQGEEFRLDEELSTTYREMVERLARDPAGQTFVFELMIRLFFQHVLGVQPESVGWRRGEARSKPADYHDGVAADFSGWSVLGSIAAAFGAVEAQGHSCMAVTRVAASGVGYVNA
jgi:hypothetical protein